MVAGQMLRGRGSNGYLGCTTNMAQTECSSVWGVFSSLKALLRVAQNQHQIFTMVAKSHGIQVVGPSKMSATPGQKPLEGIIKVNWDAAVDGGRKMIGMGAIVRDF
jgi:hypothetical protein